MPSAALPLRRPASALASSTAVAVLLALCCLVVAVGYLFMQWRALEDGARETAELHARVLETDANATFNALAESMHGAARMALLPGSEPAPGQVLKALEEPLARYPALRSLSVLNEAGQVLHSTEPGTVGLQMPLAALGELAHPDALSIGKWLPVRTLADLLAPAGPMQPRGALTLLLRVPRSMGPPWLLVGLMNTEHLALQQAMLIDDHAGRAAVLSFGGVVLHSGQQTTLEPGSSALALAPFRDFLPAREFGNYRGPGMDGQAAVGAFRTLRQWPVVVVVERSQATTKTELLLKARWVGLVLALAWALIGVYTVRVNRSQARADWARSWADALNQQVARDEERWKLALEGAGEGVWDLDLATGALNSSARVATLLGHQTGAIGTTYKQWMAFIHTRDRRPARKAVAQHLNGCSDALRLELRMRHKDGGWRWLLVRGDLTGPCDDQGHARRLTGTLVDITEQRLTEDALRSSQARRHAILQSALDAIVTIDSEGRVVDFNPAAELMFGRTQKAAAGRPIQDYIALNHLSLGQQADRASCPRTAYGSILNKHIETEALRADGSLFPVELTVVPLDNGDEVLFTATLRDISERKRAEAELRASEARAHETFEQAAVGVLHQALSRRYLRVNQTLCTLLGLAREEFLDLAPEQLLHPDDLAQQDQDLALLASGQAATLRAERQIHHKDGRYLWVRFTGSLAQSASATEPYVIYIVEDIHENKLLEEQRHLLLTNFQMAATELKRQRRALDEHTLVSVLGPTGQVISANSKLCEVSGFMNDELVGQEHPVMTNRQGAFQCDNAADSLQALREHIKGGKVWQGELQHRHKDGTPFWAATTVVPQRGEDGSLQQVFVIQTDITRRIIAERAASEARNMELNIGSRIQKSLLATVLDQRLPRTWLGACTRPSQGIDGDFLHVLNVGVDCVDVITADVMGKGLGAALIGAAAKMQLMQCMAQLMSDSSLNQHPEPAEVVAALHKAMWPSLQSLDAFITLSYVRIDSARDTITWLGCGHEEPLLVYTDGSTLTLDNQHPPIGVLEGVSYQQVSAPMHKGDALFCCSDGISDALLPNGERVGREAVTTAVKRLLAHCKAPGAIVNSLMHQLMGPGVRAVDDTSLLLAVRTGDTSMASRRELPYSMDGLTHVRDLVNFRCTQAGLDETQAALFTVACVEAYTNIVRHTKGRLADSNIELLVQLDPSELRTEFVYLADEVKLPPIREQLLEDYPEGGFGLSIMRDASDDMQHIHSNGINTILLSKSLEMA